MIAAILIAATLAKTPVTLAFTGDDGMSLRVADAIKQAFDQAPEFELTGPDPIGLLVHAPMTNVDASDAQGNVRFRYEILREGKVLLLQGEGRCPDKTPSVCADVVVRAARKLVTP